MTHWWIGIWLLLLAVAPNLSAAPIAEIRQILRQQALTPPSETALNALQTENLAQALAGIDPYARYFKPEEYRDALPGRAAWIGIGAELMSRGNEVLLSVYTGGAADQAGIADRSRLVAVNGEPIAELDLKSVAERLRGEAGSEVELLLEAPQGGQKSWTLKRKPFRPLDVEPVPPGNRRVLRIREFAVGRTRPALLATCDFMRRHSSGGTDGADDLLIVDLRDAAGGDLYEALDVAGLFLPQGTPLAEMRRPGGKSRWFHAPAGEKLSAPLIFLVGPETASAAEILAGILSYHGRAGLVGQRTYGKCTSQTDQFLSDGSVLRYTNREIFFPDGRSCSGLGLKPDTEVDNAVLQDISRLVIAAQNLK
jgi:carboxyl-terminal processing protease